MITLAFARPRPIFAGMKRMLAVLAVSTLFIASGALAQSKATPDTGSAIGGLSTGNGEGETGAGQGQSGTTRQRGAGPVNQSRPELGKGQNKLSSKPATGQKKPKGEEAQ